MLLGLLVTAPAVMAFSNINTEVDFQFIPATSTTPGGYYDVCPLNSYLERNPPVGPMNVTNCGCPAGYTLRPTARSVPPPPVVPRFVDTVRRPSSSSSFSKASPSKASSSYLESRDLLGGATSNTPPGTPPRFAGGGDMSPGNRHRRYDQPTRLRPRARPQKRFDTQTSEKVRIVA